MNIIYLLFHGLSPYSGISKKILYQVKGLEACGHQVSLCTYCIADNSHRVRMINGEIIADYGTGKLAAARKRVSYHCIYHYAVAHRVELIYVRSFHNANYKPQNKMFHFYKTFCSKITLVNTIQNVILNPI